MNIHKLTIFLLFTSLILIGFMFVSAQEETAVGGLTILQTSPVARDLDAPTDTAVAIQFDRPLNPSTVTSSTLQIFGRWSGPAEGVIGFADSTTTHTLTISNTGTADLHWQGHETACAAPADVPWLTMMPITETTAVSSSNDVRIMLSSMI